MCPSPLWPHPLCLKIAPYQVTMAINCIHVSLRPTKLSDPRCTWSVLAAWWATHSNIVPGPVHTCICQRSVDAGSCCVTDVFFKTTQCLRIDLTTCYPEGHELYQVTHSGLDAQVSWLRWPCTRHNTCPGWCTQHCPGVDVAGCSCALHLAHMCGALPNC